MRPSFCTLPAMVYGRLETTASMMYDAYSRVRSCRGDFSDTSSPRIRCHSAICSTQRRGYSSKGMANRSISSGYPALMNHGTYSALCSLLSVT